MEWSCRGARPSAITHFGGEIAGKFAQEMRAGKGRSRLLSGGKVKRREKGGNSVTEQNGIFRRDTSRLKPNSVNFNHGPRSLPHSSKDHGVKHWPRAEWAIHRWFRKMK